MLGFLRYELEDEYSAIVLAFIILVLSLVFGANGILFIAIVVFALYVIFVEMKTPRAKGGSKR